MLGHSAKEQRFIEFFLVALAISISCVFFLIQGYKPVVLHLFYLPVVLTGFFLGRYRAGVLALLCVLSAAIAAVVTMGSYSVDVSPVVMGLAILVWGSVLGLTSLLVGTLSDERRHATKELHEAYVGVVEVLSQYLQSAHPVLKARSIRVAELSQQVAAELKMSSRQIDDVRVAALLYETGNVEVTSKVIRRAVDEFDADNGNASEHTFQGRDLVCSLGSVLSGATPLLLELQDSLPESAVEEQIDTPRPGTLGARIVALVRSYDALTSHESAASQSSPEDALEEISFGSDSEYDARVLKALRSCVVGSSSREAEEPLLT